MADDSKDLIDSLPWDEIIQIIKSPQIKVKGIDEASLKFVLDEKNRPKVIESAWKSLKRTNPGASYQQAITLADLMMTFAGKVSKKSKENNS